ncbi:META domain-containing protein [Blastococcus sp. URHD0036]|uniref:META domain-containing protein n=1 Tax=Blastococcus sp. URHD0036 TaxID=1380356 RepID=UPI000495E4E9|nr:META domain-containing protein [Blastococcus sp. URHD0036]
MGQGPRVAARTHVALLAGAVLVAGLLLAACGSDDVDPAAATAGLPDLGQSLAAQQWLLDAGDSSVTGTTGPVTLEIDGGTASGTAPCNTYRGPVALDGDSGVRIGPLATTLMGCEPAVMTAEREYLDALERVRTADVPDQDRLVLTADGVRLSYTAIDAQDLLVGTWELTGVRTPGAIQSMLVGTEPTARFADDGTLAVETGCNTLGTTWTLDGRSITVEPPAGTLRICPEPAGVMEQEAAIAAALPDAATVEVTPVALTLLDADGLIVLTAQRA